MLFWMLVCIRVWYVLSRLCVFFFVIENSVHYSLFLVCWQLKSFSEAQSTHNNKQRIIISSVSASCMWTRRATASRLDYSEGKSEESEEKRKTKWKNSVYSIETHTDMVLLWLCECMLHRTICALVRPCIALLTRATTNAHHSNANTLAQAHHRTANERERQCASSKWLWPFNRKRTVNSSEIVCVNVKRSVVAPPLDHPHSDVRYFPLVSFSQKFTWYVFESNACVRACACVCV